MAKNPAKIEKQINNIINAWSSLASTATFAGMTLVQYKAAVQPSLDARAQLVDNDEERAEIIINRDKVDVTSDTVNQQVVKAVVGDVKFGDDSAFYEKLGYVRKSQRKTGLSRKSKAASAKAPAK